MRKAFDLNQIISFLRGPVRGPEVQGHFFYYLNEVIAFVNIYTLSSRGHEEGIKMW